MSVVLASAWRPRGELPRFQRLLPQLQQQYLYCVLTLPPDVPPQLVDDLGALPGVRVAATSDWSEGRYLALKAGLEFDAGHIHYVDFDRLLHWVETRPDEWRQAVQALQACDCLVFGRTPAAYATHPQALLQTEALSNQVTSHLLGLERGSQPPLDVSAGSKAFSRQAAAFLVENTRPGRALGTDAEWLVLLKRAGLRIDYREVDGLDWESADHFRQQSASPDEQRLAAQAYDADPAHWARRVQVAEEIIAAGLDAAQRPVVVPAAMLGDTLPAPDNSRPGTSPAPTETGPSAAQVTVSPVGATLVVAQASLTRIAAGVSADFDFEAVFAVDDYMYFYGDVLTDEVTDRQVGSLVQFLQLNRPMRILDLACGFGRHANRLAALGHQVTGIDLTPGFLEIARQDALRRGVQVDYRQGDMRQLDFQAEFDRVLLLFTAFGYFSDEENLEVLQRIGWALRPGGLFCMDIHNRDTYLIGFQPDRVKEKDGNLMIDRQRFDSYTGRVYNQRIVIRDSQRRDKPFFVRLYNPSEIRSLLSQAGLQVVQILGGWDGQPLAAETRRMVIIAKK